MAPNRLHHAPVDGSTSMYLLAAPSFLGGFNKEKHMRFEKNGDGICDGNMWWERNSGGSMEGLEERELQMDFVRIHYIHLNKKINKDKLCQNKSCFKLSMGLASVPCTGKGSRDAWKDCGEVVYMSLQMTVHPKETALNLTFCNSAAIQNYPECTACTWSKVHVGRMTHTASILCFKTVINQGLYTQKKLFHVLFHSYL